MTTMCENCGRGFPDHLINIMVVQFEGRNIDPLSCPICAMSLRNQIHGLPEGTPFRGRTAQEAYDKVVEFLGSGAQNND